VSDTWTVARVLTWAAADLRKRSSTSPRLDAELMLALVLGCDRVKLIIDADRPLDPIELSKFKQLHKRRRLGEPIAYIRGERDFYGRSFRVDQRVLVPRPETELLVEVGLKRTRRLSLCARVLDVCTGSGCVAITLKKERPTNTVLAADVSPDALDLARLNCWRLGARVGLVCSDLFSSEALASSRSGFDLITANPPYLGEADMAELAVDIRNFEPTIALAAGVDGLDVTRRLLADAPTMLAPGGVLAVEVVAGAADQVRGLFAEAGLAAIETDRDFGRHERVVSGVLA